MILIADDFESEIDLLEKILFELGIDKDNIKIARDGKQAMELINLEHFEHLITDYNMPFFNGSEVIITAQKAGIYKILLRSSHSVSRLRQNLEDYKINPTGIELVGKRDTNLAELKELIKKFIIS